MPEDNKEQKKPAVKKAATKKAATKKAAAKKTESGLRIASSKDGFRRGGHAWSHTPTDVPISAFTEEQLEQIHNEPLLSVVEIKIEIDPDAAPATEETE